MREPSYLISQQFGTQGEYLETELRTLKGKASIEMLGPVETGNLDRVIETIIVAASKGDPMYIAFGNPRLPSYIQHLSREEYFTFGMLQNAMLVVEVDLTGHIRIPSLGFTLNKTLRTVDEATRLLSEQLESWVFGTALSASGGGTSLLGSKDKTFAIIKFWTMYGTDTE